MEGVTIAPWLMPLLTGICVALFGWLLARQNRRDEQFQTLRDRMNDLELRMAKEYFSTENASVLIVKLDNIVAELHSQNVVLTEVKTELRASRQMQTAAAGQHMGMGGGHS